eukprot:652749-Rhodomonas_salina.2
MAELSAVTACGSTGVNQLPSAAVSAAAVGWSIWVWMVCVDVAETSIGWCYAARCGVDMRC